MDAPTHPRVTGRKPRLLYVDWLRGFAVVTMIVWHTMDAWTRPDGRTTLAWDVIILIGGCAAPLFLFLAGVSVALSGAAAMEKGGHDRTRVGWRLQTRGWQIFGLAHLFRLQSFLLNPAASWSSLLKPDILNILGLGMVAAGFCWARAASRARQIIWLLVPSLAIVLLTPASRLWAWPALLRPYAPRLEAYIRPVGTLGVFTLFPWVGLVLAGTLVGLLLSEDRPGVFPKGIAIGGLATIAAGVIGAFLPAVTPSEFWSPSLAYFLIRTGTMTLALPVAWWWLRLGQVEGWSPMLLFGRASLFVYWVHVELAYGVFTHPIQRRLPLGWAIAVFGLFTAGLLALSQLWVRRRRPVVPEWLGAPIDAPASVH